MVKKQFLKLKGKTAVFADWANVCNWKESLKKEVDPEKLFKHLKNYPQIQLVNFYYGQDKNQKSKAFLKRIGYRVSTKPVKYIIVGKLGATVIKKRKCDFDIEIRMPIYSHLEKNFESFIFFTGDGDFKPLYKFLIKKKEAGDCHLCPRPLGKRSLEIKKGNLQIINKKIEICFEKNAPAQMTGRD